MQSKSIYAPAPDTKAAIALAHIRAKHPEAVSQIDLAELMQCDSRNVANNLTRCIQYGLIVVEKDGNRPHYRMADQEALNTREPSELSESQLQAYAKRAVIMLRNTTKSSVDIAAWCDTTPAIIDKALAKLADEGKLVRISVLRGGVQMFDYRWGATYVPHDVDFAGPVASSVPVPSVQPVADKITEKPRKPASTPTNPNSPWRKEGMQLPGSPVLKRSDALASSAELGKKEADERGVADLVQDLHSIGFTTSSRVHDDTIKVPDFKQQDAEAMLGWQVQKSTSTELNDDNVVSDPWPEFTITNRGFMVISNGAGVVELTAREALDLKRFLDNTSILEELAAGGAL